MGDLWIALLILGGAGLVTATATAALLSYLRRHSILDHPGVRSSHVTPTPRGGGVALVGVTLAVWGLIALWADALPERFPLLLLGIALLMVVSGADDLRGLSPLRRLAWQAVAVALGIALLGREELVLQGALPLWLDRAVTFIGWLWLVNLFNFMDGIDGITAVETATVSIGVGGVVLLGGGSPANAYLAAGVAGASLGFLPWNWYRARVFLGDVGSIPLGYMVGWLLIGLAVRGYWAAAAILPLYYVTDATVTLVRRVLRGAAPWEPHRDHFYQHATPLGVSHAPTVLKVLAADVVLVLLALVSDRAVVPALVGAFIVVGALSAVLAKGRRWGPPPPKS